MKKWEEISKLKLSIKKKGGNQTETINLRTTAKTMKLSCENKI